MASRGRTLLISGHNSIGNYKCRRRHSGCNEISREEDEGHATAAAAGGGNDDLVLLPHSGRRRRRRPANDADCSGGHRQKANGA